MTKSSLITWAIILGLLGGVASYASGRTMCLMDSCILITEGEGFNAKGIEINSGQAQLLKKSPVFIWGLAGICLVAGLVKDKKSSD